MPIFFLEFLNSFLFNLVISFSPMIIFPESGFSRPFKHLINVDLPAPLKPIIPKISP